MAMKYAQAVTAVFIAMVAMDATQTRALALEAQSQLALLARLTALKYARAVAVVFIVMAAMDATLTLALAQAAQ